VTKLGGEHLCQLYRANHGIDVVILRYFSVYGPRQRPDMAFHRFCDAALANEPIEVFGDGTQTRDFTFVSDVVTATLAASSATGVEGEVFNIGGGTQISVNTALELITELVGHQLDVRYMDPRSGDVNDTGAETSRARAQLGFAPSIGFEEGLSAQFGWMVAAAQVS
jgi:UDP-glucose 4-epimerase